MNGREVWMFQSRCQARTCPVCRTVLDGATGMHADGPPHSLVPHVGAITLCAVCAVILIVTEESFRVAVDADLDRLDPDMKRILLALQERRPHFPVPGVGRA